ncbi:MAG TPA: hypothetical protein VMF69_07460 [Gemmataceae bacterium]|nr:hypothetical protein [Gemmataceae bacterium]
MAKNRFVLDTLEGIKLIHSDGTEELVSEMRLDETLSDENQCEDEIGKAKQEGAASPNILNGDPDKMC